MLDIRPRVDPFTTSRLFGSQTCPFYPSIGTPPTNDRLNYGKDLLGSSHEHTPFALVAWPELSRIALSHRGTITSGFGLLGPCMASELLYFEGKRLVSNRPFT
jgi:hypothetical protein